MRKVLASCSLTMLVAIATAFCGGCGGGNSATTATTAAPATTLNSTTPATGATGVVLNGIITAAFSTSMTAASITTSTFLVTGPGTTAVSGIVTYNAVSNVATFTPSSPLAPNTTFTGTITTGAKDAAGNALASNIVWTFKTGATSDTTAPRLATSNPTNPAAGAVGVAVNQRIIATFTEAMNPSTITTSTFSLTRLVSGLPVAVPGTVSTAGTIATFAPTSNLTASTLFTATITTGVTDLAGNALASNFSWSFTTAATGDTTAPTVTLTNPLNAATGVPMDKKVNATFSEAMDPSTINTANFTVTGPGTTFVNGNVAYDTNTNIATFRPHSNLPQNTLMTATITTGTKDLAGNALVGNTQSRNFVWTFTTTGNAAVQGQATVDLGAATDFAILAGSTITNVNNPGTTINGNLGLSPGGLSSVTGFPPGVVNGTIFTADNVAQKAIVDQAKLDLTRAFNDAAGRSTNAIVVSDGELGGKTLAPGLYKSAPGSFVITSVDCTLDAQGDAEAVFIFQMPSSTLTVGNGRQVILAGGAQTKNIFWQVGTSATLGTTCIFKGTIMADQSITLQTGARLDGRALARIAAVTIDTNVVTKPARIIRR